LRRPGLQRLRRLRRLRLRLPVLGRLPHLLSQTAFRLLYKIIIGRVRRGRPGQSVFSLQCGPHTRSDAAAHVG
jgi:hypothetical protein